MKHHGQPDAALASLTSRTAEALIWSLQPGANSGDPKPAIVRLLQEYLKQARAQDVRKDRREEGEVVSVQSVIDILHSLDVAPIAISATGQGYRWSYLERKGNATDFLGALREVLAAALSF